MRELHCAHQLTFRAEVPIPTPKTEAVYYSRFQAFGRTLHGGSCCVQVTTHTDDGPVEPDEHIPLARIEALRLSAFGREMNAIVSARAMQDGEHVCVCRSAVVRGRSRVLHQSCHFPRTWEDDRQWRLDHLPGWAWADNMSRDANEHTRVLGIERSTRPLDPDKLLFIRSLGVAVALALSVQAHSKPTAQLT